MVTAADRAKGPARASVWLGGKVTRTRRTDQPAGLDLDKITAATVRLLDSEGLAKFSMRRLAAELGVTAMSVYWYVDTKDDLLELALDAVMGELALPDAEEDGGDEGRSRGQDRSGDQDREQDQDRSGGQGAGDWRVQLRRLAAGYRSILVRHPWVSPLVGVFLNIGPHAVKFAAASQDVMRHSDLPLRGQTGGLAAVFQFVYGFGTVEGHFRDRCARAGMTQDEYHQHAMGGMSEQPSLRRTFEQAQDVMAARGGDTVEEMRERDFDFALDLLIAGIEAKREAGEEPERGSAAADGH
ncbi:TetR/AcrR family transcriptional regulator [Streptomyces sp. SID10853]|uniref:TetR/AcrR family transcriptional regulator n=1 Tax=Streptomyces sp. SID10853 TaxID=2706028 RepID=UPI0013C18A5A|nr:TetR/AcrR family transcriptional regulator [Streptomyces sp. SID10853]NDZ79066.1 TetR/AcrR family transcriptional regulator [Streptomyces sp. SID10853]